MQEPAIVIAASPREWAQRLHRHVADHGGARVRATVLHPVEALAERCAVFLVDDTTTFLSRHLIDELHRLGRRVLGVYDPDDPDGKGGLISLGVDAVMERSAAPERFVETIEMLADQAATGDVAFEAIVADLTPTPPARVSGRLVVVAAPPGGCGATEVTVAIGAAAGRRGQRAVLADVDETAPALAQRLGVPLYPNLRAAVDAVEHGDGTLTAALALAPALGAAVLPGLAAPRDWVDVRPAEVVTVVEALLAADLIVVANVGCRTEALPGGGPQRYGLSRAVLQRADIVVGVGAPSPVGIARLLDWAATVGELTPAAALHVVVNRAPASSYARAEVEGELRRALRPAGLWFLPEDSRVAAAAWRGLPTRDGPFSEAVEPLAAAVLPPVAASARRRRLSVARWRRGARTAVQP